MSHRPTEHSTFYNMETNLTHYQFEEDSDGKCWFVAGQEAPPTALPKNNEARSAKAGPSCYNSGNDEFFCNFESAADDCEHLRATDAATSAPSSTGAANVCSGMSEGRKRTDRRQTRQTSSKSHMVHSQTRTP
jgi:hypothetical protein